MNALYKTRENFNCYLTVTQAITLTSTLDLLLGTGGAIVATTPAGVAALVVPTLTLAAGTVLGLVTRTIGAIGQGGPVAALWGQISAVQWLISQVSTSESIGEVRRPVNVLRWLGWMGGRH